jgi:uncharacterized membrane protein YdfJ with MMPL/SSD domain
VSRIQSNIHRPSCLAPNAAGLPRPPGGASGMPRLMIALEAWLRRHRRLVLTVWGVAIVAAVPLASRQTKHLSGGGFTDPASSSGQVEHALARFPGAEGPTLAAVLVPRRGAPSADLRRAIGGVERIVARVGGVHEAAGSGVAALTSAVARPGRPVVIPLEVRGGEAHSIDAASALRKALGVQLSAPARLSDGGVDVNVVGRGAVWAAVQSWSQADVKTAVARGLPVIAIVLVVAFGSLTAALLPLGLGVAAVLISGAIIYLLSLGITMSIFITNVAAMLGLGVAVDYSLFVLARYREEVRAGRTLQDARATALATSGIAVVFSGLTVMASLTGLFLIRSAALRSIATGAILVVAVAVLGASTLLPALLSMLGARAHESDRLTRALRRLRRRRPSETPREGFWVRWSNTVMRRPVVFLLAAITLLLVLAIPVVRLNMETPGIGQLPASDPIRVSVRAAAAVAGPGAFGPVQIVVEPRGGALTDPTSSRLLRLALARVAGDPLVQGVSSVGVSSDHRALLFAVRLRADPESNTARVAVARLRGQLAALAGRRASVWVGGTTGLVMDFDHLVASSMWKIVVFILLLSFVMLLVLLRSVVVALKAGVMTMLSVLASYGVLVAVFQWGWLGFLGLQSAPYIDTITPPLVLVFAFGLSMDYEVFMLSRIRERYAATADTSRAVAEGLASSARTVTSAAAIMVAVFLAFVSVGLPSVQRLGVAMATAIALDATVVRLVLLPSAMVLLGRWNWWLPRPLARVLPPAHRGHPGDLRDASQPAVGRL